MKPVTILRTLAAALGLLTSVATTGMAAPSSGAASSPDLGALIVGGTPVADGSWPSIVALVPTGVAPELGAFCGGTLIAPTVVLTAAHCLLDDAGAPTPAESIDVVIGVEDLLAPAERIAVAQTRVHPGYRLEGDAPDAALLILSRPAAAPVAVYAAAGQDADLERPGQIAGWGQDGEDSANYPTRLVAAPVTIFTGARCRRMLGPAFHLGGALCAGRVEGGVDTCAGDSGGPLRDSTGLVVGITSWGVGCGRPGLPGIYTRVSTVAGWITKTLAPASSVPPAAAPARAPRARALAAHARPGAMANLRYRLLGQGETTHEEIVIRSGNRVIARLQTDAGPARSDVEYRVAWRVPSDIFPSSRLRFCVATRIVSGSEGTPSCAPLRLSRRR